MRKTLCTSHCINDESQIQVLFEHSQIQVYFRFTNSKTRLRIIEKEEYVRYIYSDNERKKLLNKNVLGLSGKDVLSLESRKGTVLNH